MMSLRSFVLLLLCSFVWNGILSHTAIERANESYRLTLPAPKVLAQINVTDLQERLVL